MATNVLVYDGPGVSISALTHTLRTLRRLLPAYDIQTTNARTLAVEPWQSSTALLVLPGGRDLPYVRSLSELFSQADLGAGQARRRADEEIARFVQAGGSFLGICAGAYFASGRCIFEPGTDMEVIGDRPALRFFPGECMGTVYPGFVYESDAGARLIELELAAADSDGLPTHFQCEYNGGGAFISADSYASQGVDVLARYSHSDPALTGPSTNSRKPRFAGQAAAVLCNAGLGKALLYGSHPEFPLRPEAEPTRLFVFGQHLSRLALRVHVEQSSPASEDQMPSITDPPRLNPLFLTSPDLPALIDKIRCAAASPTSAVSRHLPPINTLMTTGKLRQPEFSIADGNDVFHLLSAGGNATLEHLLGQAEVLLGGTLTSSYIDYVPTPPTSSTDPAEANSKIEADPDLHAVPKYIFTLPAPPSSAADRAILSNAMKGLTPYFDIYAYLSALSRGREAVNAVISGGEGTGAPVDNAQLLGGIDAGPRRWGSGSAVRLGEAVMYGQVVTSTQTMLDKNFKLLRTLPTGFTSIATHQVSGRGRGKNAWISPLGCFQFSLVLRLPASAAPSIVFIQYLAGLAVVLSLREGVGLPPDVGREVRARFGEAVGGKVRIKWPNDLYAEVEDEEDESAAARGLGERKGTFTKEGKRYAKLGGILVNSQFADNEFLVVVGYGVNVLNRQPTTSISDLILATNASAAGTGAPTLPILSQEEFGGGVLATFERLWTVFEQAGSFRPFVDAYKEVWLHSDQLATLTDTDPPTPIRIVGISSDYGFLRATPASSTLTSASQGAWGEGGGSGGGGSGRFSRTADGQWIDLQPDGNSFDMLQNLIKRKD
ncbi:hypothetical protein V8E36_001867 [Tilletia maclaganii]